AADGSATGMWSSTVAGQAARWGADAGGPGAAAAVFGPRETPRLAADDAGNAYAVAAVAPNTIRFSRYDAATGTWSTPVSVAGPEGGTDPRIAANGRGDVAITFTRSLGRNLTDSESAVYMQRAPAGGGFSTPV